MSPEECIASLDDALAEAGEDVILRRVVGTINSLNIDVGVRALVRNFRLKEEPLAGSNKQAVLIIIMSPTQIKNAQWPGGVPEGQRVDPQMPRRGDWLRIKGRWDAIEACEPLCMEGQNVRYEMQVIG